MQAARYPLVASRLNNDRAGNGGLEYCARGYSEERWRATVNMLKYIQIRNIMLIRSDAPGCPCAGRDDFPERMKEWWA